ncbi:MAG: hypothetical protein US95_C0020G0031 [Candidatus Woesebacteria bacterium GW2011_GWB1_38_5]|nr:MAG: hypothetical protein US95_C0020G0031 [Candidatus Woesebacteria bacterium GW2011_GWB1_38_5]
MVSNLEKNVERTYALVLRLTVNDMMITYGKS